jgi:hypothetical protein
MIRAVYAGHSALCRGTTEPHKVHSVNHARERPAKPREWFLSSRAGICALMRYFDQGRAGE